jgi:uncharacterized metal-binding protein YceD (DUF177 family)
VETVRAGVEERAALATRLGLVSIDMLEAVIRLEREASGVVHVSGRLEAEFVQTCIVTLAPFPSHVEDSFETDFSADSPVESPSLDAEFVFDLENDPPEPIIDGNIDLGELVAQYLSLALDPYPRAPGVAFDPVWVADEESMSPFAVLKTLKGQA